MNRPLAQTFLTLRPKAFEYQLGLLESFDTQVIENIGECHFDMPSHAVGLADVLAAIAPQSYVGIYTHSLPAEAAVVWSGGLFQLPWHSLLQRGCSVRNHIRCFRLNLFCRSVAAPALPWSSRWLIAAIIWNLGTWWLG
jgi:hypothetical protein